MLFGQEHIDRYIETDGEVGYDWENGTSILLLTTTGAKSGEQRVAPLIFVQRDGVPAVIASKGGAPEPPAWFVNLEADPQVKVQIKDDVFTARARVATPQEKPAWWELAVQAWPAYADYQRKTDREIPVVILDRV
jgi:deazaflavin-dependent oxidoreductase (nitroreductase family)